MASDCFCLFLLLCFASATSSADRPQAKRIQPHTLTESNQSSFSCALICWNVCDRHTVPPRNPCTSTSAEWNASAILPLQLSGSHHPTRSGGVSVVECKPKKPQHLKKNHSRKQSLRSVFCHGDTHLGYTEYDPRTNVDIARTSCLHMPPTASN